MENIINNVESLNFSIGLLRVLGVVTMLILISFMCWLAYASRNEDNKPISTLISEGKPNKLITTLFIGSFIIFLVSVITVVFLQDDKTNLAKDYFVNNLRNSEYVENAEILSISSVDNSKCYLFDIDYKKFDCLSFTAKVGSDTISGFAHIEDLVKLNKEELQVRKVPIPNELIKVKLFKQSEIYFITAK